MNAEDRIMVDKIQNFNCTGMCGEKLCDQPHTHYCKHVIHGVTLYTPLCEKHADIIKNREFDAIADMIAGRKKFDDGCERNDCTKQVIRDV